MLPTGADEPRVQVSPERTEVPEGSTVRLYCRVSGSPTATISWEKQGGTLPPQVSWLQHPEVLWGLVACSRYHSPCPHAAVPL